MDARSASSPGTTRRAPTVRRRLLYMALSLIAPALVLMVFLTQLQYDEGRRRYEAQLLVTTRALALAADGQIDQARSIVEALAVSRSLQTGRFAEFEIQARQVAEDRSGWIVLMDERQRQILNTRAQPGAALPQGGFPEEAWRAMRAGRTVVSNLTTGTLTGQPIIAVDTPVVIDGRMHVLSYIQEPSAFQSIFEAQDLPDAWTGSIVDREGRLVARSRDAARLVGRTATADMREAMARSTEGVIATHTLDGTPTFSAFSRSPIYGWAFIVGVPREEVQAAAVQGAGAILAIMIVLITLGAATAVYFSQRISQDIRSLSDDAAALARGEASVRARPGLAETREVRRALQMAAEALREREVERIRASERQQLMIHELNHRVKNTLATVQSLAWQTLGRGAQDSRVERFTERLLALSQAHDLLTRRVWENADLREVVAQTLQPYGARAIVAGDELLLSPTAAVSLSMVFHELATNAAKYGALSLDSGRISVAWEVAEGELQLQWRESGGPPVRTPARAGFGSRLIRSSIGQELGGSADVRYAPGGLEVDICVPISARVTPIAEAAV
ncbi:MAG: sensor histidine kinase [Phenylobacterium sp.]|uniref:sensor histidine kinase n=1 Tax=Phenylobacterium sp. TaxID=1871053 RepID=UPI00391B048F